MEENNRRIPPKPRGSIDGIQTRRPDVTPPSAQNAPQADNLATQQQKPSEKKPEKAKSQNPKKGRNLAAIILAVIILLGLSGLAVYAGLQQNPDNLAAEQSESSSQENSQETSAEIIDKTLDEIDQLDSKSDSSGQELSDEKLGL